MNRAQRLVYLLKERGWTIATAESLTGGMLASAICDVAGASAVFLEGVVSYSNASKMLRLGVREETLAAHSAVSRETAAEMAEGVRAALSADIAIATTGVAGPDAFDADGNPRGLFYIGIVTAEQRMVRPYFASGTRAQIRQKATTAALKVAIDVLESSDAHKGSLCGGHCANDCIEA